MKITVHTFEEMHITANGKMFTVHNVNGGEDFTDSNKGNIAEAIIKNLVGLFEINPSAKGAVDVEDIEVKGNAAQFRSHTKDLPSAKENKAAFIEAVAASVKSWLEKNGCRVVTLVIIRNNVTMITMSLDEMFKMLTCGAVRVSVDEKARKIRLADFANDWAFTELMNFCKAHA